MKKLLLLIMTAFVSHISSAGFSDTQEITRAAEAAPANVTSGAAFMRFKNGKFSVIKTGENNFTCLVISDPKGRYEPACFNEQAMRSVFPAYELNMRLLYQGKSYKEAHDEIKSAFDKGRLPSAEHGAIVYMMSPNNKMFNPKTNTLGKTPIHHMYFYPKLADDTFPVISDSVYVWQGFPHLTALIIDVGEGKY